MYQSLSEAKKGKELECIGLNWGVDTDFRKYRNVKVELRKLQKADYNTAW